MLTPFITTVLTEYRSNEYIESVLTLRVEVITSVDQTLLECFISELVEDFAYVDINSSGICMIKFS